MTFLNQTVLYKQNINFFSMQTAFLHILKLHFNVIYKLLLHANFSLTYHLYEEGMKFKCQKMTKILHETLCSDTRKSCHQGMQGR